MQKNKHDEVSPGRKDVNILEVRLDSTSTASLLRIVRDKIAQKVKFTIVTPNPEIVMLAQKDADLRKTLNDADISLPDGFGLVLAARFLGEGALKRLPGREVFLDLVQLANKLNWKLYFLGGLGSEANDAKEILERSYKSVKIQASPGPRLDENANPLSEIDRKSESDTVEAINNFKPEILFVAFGAPRQEKWVAKWLPKLDVGGSMVVGGAFRYISGNATLPPKWLERMGLEWLWRLIAEPGRIKRIITATIIFPLSVFLYKIRNR